MSGPALRRTTVILLVGLATVGATGRAAADAASAAAPASVPAPQAAPVAPAGAYSAAALYNLANAYARAGRPGLAVLNYERAGLLAPGDPDIAANLQQVRESAHVPTPPPPSRTAASLRRMITAASPTAISWLGVAGVALFGMCLVSSRLRPYHRWQRRLAVGCALAALATTGAHALILWPSAHSAVVVAADAPVRVSPVPMGDPLFTLPEAETVRVAARHEDFVLVRTQTGKAGWMSRADVVPVVPDR